MEMKLTKDKILEWLDIEEEEFNIDIFRRKYGVDPASSTLKVTLSRLVDSGDLKRSRRGWYRKVKRIEPIVWWDGEDKPKIDFVWAYGVEDNSSFGFDESIEIFAGDTIVIAGYSNQGKTALALNLLINNINLFEGATMMVNEYKPQRFRNRMKQFTWADYWNKDKPRFDLLPITKNHADYIKPNHLNIVDWLHISGDFWTVADIIQDIQMQLREGIAVVVLQKTGAKDFGVGGDWGTFLPAVYLTIDPPGKLRVIKVKSSPPGHLSPIGKLYAFDIVDRGSKFHNIREVKDCPVCKGRRTMFNSTCKHCSGKGYTEIEL